jgi:16S rRNA (cytidine1402-2'-O)-methyltransferase
VSDSSLYVVSTPIGNLEDLSPRARRILTSVDAILAEDTRRTGLLLHQLGVQTPMLSFHQHNERSREDEVLRRMGDGASFALVSDAGTPLVSDPGEGLVARVRAAGFPVVPVPGPSAVLAALVASGFPAIPFAFLGFFPRKGKDRQAALARVGSSSETLVLFESAPRLARLLQDLSASGHGMRSVAIARELTKIHEEIWSGPVDELLRDLPSHTLRGEVTVVVSPSSAPARGHPGDTALSENEAIDARARALLASGERPARVAREVAEALDLPKNRVYPRVMALAETRASAVPEGEA